MTGRTSSRPDVWGLFLVLVVVAVAATVAARASGPWWVRATVVVLATVSGAGLVVLRRDRLWVLPIAATALLPAVVITVFGDGGYLPWLWITTLVAAALLVAVTWGRRWLPEPARARRPPA